MEKMAPQDVLRYVEKGFGELPVVTRTCVRALNVLLYNMQFITFEPAAFKRLVFLVSKGFTSEDNYLKNYIHTVLIELARRTADGIITLNCIIKDLDNRKTPANMRNIALRALFSNLPAQMRYDFEKYISSSVIDGNDTGVVLAAEYFPKTKVPLRVSTDLRDYHQAFFNRLPVNRHSSLIEISKLLAAAPGEVSSFLTSATDPVVFFEAAKQLVNFRPEVAAPYADRAIGVLRTYLKTSGPESLMAIRLLNQLSLHFPTKVAAANRDLEDLVRSSSKPISLLAIITLLRTGTEDTIETLASKMEPYMHSMSDNYKSMAIDMMEKLFLKSRTSNSMAYFKFLKKALVEKGSSAFKRFLLTKLDVLLKNTEDRAPIIKFLCAYMEDPEYYRINIDILGMLGIYLEEPHNLVHVYNRLILDNAHVQKAAIQTLFDLDARGVVKPDLDRLGSLSRDADAAKLYELLSASKSLPRGRFDLSELGDVRGEVMKYLDEIMDLRVEESVEVEVPDFVKECRPISLTSPTQDVLISVVKTIRDETVSLAFKLENRMSGIKISNGTLSLDVDGEIHSIPVPCEDMAQGPVVAELELPKRMGMVINGVFDYTVCFDNDVDTDEISLEPFDITVLDFVRPVPIDSNPTASREIVLNLSENSAAAASRIAGITNMNLVAERGFLRMTGMYNSVPLVIEAALENEARVRATLNVFCDDQELLNSVCEVFE